MAKVSVGTTFPMTGDFCWHPDETSPTKIILTLPGVGTVRLPVVRGANPSGGQGENQVWGWNGDIERPTLTPSIDASTADAHWHGHLTDGKLTP